MAPFFTICFNQMQLITICIQYYTYVTTPTTHLDSRHPHNTSTRSTNLSIIMKFSGIVLALCAMGATAFMPQSTPRFMTKLSSGNQYV